MGCLLALAAWCPGADDVIELRSGGVVRGRYAGGTADTIRFETPAGVQVLTRQEVLALTLAAGGPATQPAAPASAAPAAAAVPAGVPAAAAAPQPAAPKTITIPAGSLLVVKVQTPVSSKSKAGTKFQSVLIADVAGDTGGIKAGIPILGRVEESKQAGRLAGKSSLELSLTELNLNGKLVPVVTSSFAEAGKSSFRKTARNTAAGAVVGAAVDDDGAGKGAAVGAAVSVIRKGDSVTVPAGAVLEFRLLQPLTMTVAP
jgi:hypothetical protein